MTPRLDQLRRCFEGAAPSLLATCATDGVPNVTCVSQVHFVDDEHVALSFQFLNKTRENILANPAASLLLLDPCSGARYRLAIEYARTESEGPLFECMRARLASIASHTGMAGVFRLLGADVYKVAAIEAVPGPCRAQPERRRDRLAALRTLSRRLAAADELEAALDLVLEGLAELFGMQHALVLCSDESGQWLYTVASHGYAQSGVGSEVALGEGVIGVAAQQRTPIRLNWPAAEYAYGSAVRAAAAREGLIPLETEISFPGLIDPQSQLAAPIEAGDWLAGVLYVESAEEGRFDHQDEDALVTIAQQLGVVMRCLIRPVEIPEPLPLPPMDAIAPAGRPVAVRYFATTQSVFLDDDYLIKGVAGAVLWLLINDLVRDGRAESSNRALRLDPRLRLPDLDDNLETRLILLQRRLAERCDWLRIEKLGRGRFALRLDRPVSLVDVEEQQA